MISNSVLIFTTILSLFVSKFLVFAGNTNDDDCLARIDQELGPLLSAKASIVHYTSAAPRWSDYDAPRPGSIVNVAEEQDVIRTVKYCIENNLDFLAQTGGHAWTTTFDINEKDVLINMRGLNHVRVNDAGDEITFGGGSLIEEVVEEAYQNGVQVVMGSCDCVGALGALLGGGLSRLQGRYGLMSDNLLSANLVTATGELITVTPESSPDLWWAIRGAGANFGVVTSATMKAYPTVNNGIAWVGSLIYTPDKLEAVVEAIQNLDFQKEMTVFFMFVAPPPDYTPSIIVGPYYLGSEAEGKEAFKAFYDIGPVADSTEELPYNETNSKDNTFCTKGGRKPAYTAGLKKLDPQAFREVWNEYTTLITENSGLRQSGMLVECYSYKTVREFADDSSAFPHRDVNFQALMVPWYDDASLDTIATDFGKKVREIWRRSSGFEEPRTYVNFAHGDESLETLYGESLDRLKEIKKQWDKDGRFSQFFPITTN